MDANLVMQRSVCRQFTLPPKVVLLHALSSASGAVKHWPLELIVQARIWCAGRL